MTEFFRAGKSHLRFRNMDSDDRLTISLPSLGKAMDMFYDKAYLQGYTAGYTAAKAEIRSALGISSREEE